MAEEKGPRKKKRGRRVLIVLGVLVVVGLILHWPTEGEFTISRETTYVTGPLNPDGTINYVAALNEMMSKGVTPENNAAPLLIRAMGLNVFTPQARQTALQGLGIGDLPVDGDYFTELDEYQRDEAAASGRPKYGTPEWDGQQDLLDKLGKTPWSAEEHPHVAGWLKANDKAFSLVVKASKRPRYYLPRVSESSNPRLLKSLTVFPPYLRLSEALSARAMLRLDGGDVDGTMADLLALHRLARLLAQPPLLIDKLIALAVEESAAQGTVALANSGRLAGDQARRMLLELNRAGPMPGEMADAFDRGERLFMLDGVMFLYAGGSLDTTVSAPFASRKYYGTAIDWDRMLRNFNRWYDRIAAAVREPDRRKRREAENALISELQRMKPGGPAAIIKLILGRLGGRASKAIMTDALSNVFVSLSTPIFYGFANSKHRAVVQYDLARVALALAAFRAEKGVYPQKLSELSPAYVKKVPADVFAEGPLVYKRDGKGYLLYSVGKNMKDDGGVEDEDTGKDDIAVRVK